MNRDIITADIKWDNNADPYIDLDVKIDEADYKRNIYIEDIKLYNQNTFVNPTNPNGGVSIIDAPVVSGNPSKKFWYKKVANAIDELFVEDAEGDYIKVDGDYIPVDDEEEETVESTEEVSEENEEDETRYSFIENNSYFYYDESNDIYKVVDYNNRKAQNFYTKTNLIEYEYKNLQLDPSFVQNFDINNDIIIISVKIHPNPDDNCQSDFILKAIYNKRLLLLESMAGVREINDTCTIPRRFIDFILRQKAIDLAQENNDIDLLCKYFRLFSGSIGTNNIEFAPCGCLRG